MNIEQRRAYIEVVHKMDEPSLLHESRSLRWKINFTTYGALVGMMSLPVFATLAATQDAWGIKFLIPAVVSLGGVTYLGKKSSEYMNRSNVVNFELQRRGLGMRLSNFQRMGMAYMRLIDSISPRDS